ncbi:MAG TPA: hypothetical protein VK658_05340, partial [Chryseolinea sp.]|nr:hypothetical protein [Chryseolinea sp.]
MSMNTTDIASLCPYTGLRSFTEEESIYFKGRDTQIDQITEQLSARKFLMLTGASGDGKSSLIYAGLVPQARSGFFKAKFTNWTVVDFRPERSPLKNLIHAIAGAFTVEASTIETELSRGFSSLTDIYLNSEFYPDYNIGGVGGSDADHRQQLRKASNLMVIVDQFEEFFTNPENNDGEVPNQSSQIVVNLMLETARIALERSLPIYVVFTMRSDYIGQCSAFRGLPEFIGYSQFFVPRLTRGELKQVIEEPAQLNGNTISNRLTERLIYDLNEGIDQLPILQHALSQIWRVANAGREEMDLIHYSMVGGLSADELPAADKHRFKAWLTSLPENQRQHYAEAGLDKVIEIHARKLYDDAADHYASIENSVALHTRTVKNCIAIAFACLTKIDNGRAVRNRMSLTEIAQVINQPEVTPQVLGKILEIFRLPDNSFIRPFVFADNSETLPDTVLDITHESLIRNWSMLKRWANQEFAFYTTFEDLRKQIARWKVHHKSKGYLIPIGPLTYFEGWYAECKPNAAWIRRYIDKSGNAETDRQLSVNLLEDINTYLAQSAKNVALSRLLIKYGAGKIAGIVALAAVAVLAIYFVFDIYRKKSSTVIEQVKTEGRQLLKSGDVGFEHKAAYLITEERLVPGSALELLRGMPQIEQLSINYDIWRLLYPSRRFHRTQFSTQLVDHLDKQLRSDSFKTLPVARALQARVAFSLMSSYENYYGPENIKRAWVTENAAALFPLIIENFKREPASGSQTSLINHGIQHWLTFGQATPAQIDQLIGLISPLDSTSRFNLFYKRGGLEPDGYRPLDFGGGYHVLASLYAAKGDIAKVL